MSNTKFEVVDRRRENKVVQEIPIVMPAPQVEHTGDKSSWESVDWILVMAPSPRGTLIVGRMCGIRSDDMYCQADYLLPPKWPQHLDWPAEAKKRLDTFLNCGCTPQGPCAIHKMLLPQWINADTQRLELIGTEPLSKPVERMAEQARGASRIAIPRG